MNSRLIKTPTQHKDWIEERRHFDHDFEPMTPQPPFLVVWDDGESNGYPSVAYETFSIDELDRTITYLQSNP